MLPQQQRLLIRTLSGLVIVLIGLYFAAGIYFQSAVKRSVDDFALFVSPYTEFSYQEVVADISGAIRIQEVTLVPRGVRDPISIKQLTLIGPDALYLLNNSQFLTGADQAPAQMEIRIEGLRLNLGNDFAQNIQEGLKQAAAQRGQQVEDQCGVGGMADFTMLKAMGISDLLLDAVIDYSFSSVDQTLQASLSFESADMNKLSLGVELGDISLDAIQTGVGQIPSLSSLDFNYRVEPKFGARLLMACAGQNGMSPTDYQEKLVQQIVGGLDHEAAAGANQSLSQAVETFYQQWGDFYLTAHPSTPIGMLNLLFMQPNQLTETLNMSVRVNNNPVMAVKLDPARPDERAQEESLAVLFGLESPVKAAAAVTARSHSSKRYVQVGFDELQNHLNEKVRIYTGEFPTRIGKLVSVTKHEVALQQRTHGGKFTAHIQRDNVLRAEVRMLQKAG